MNKNLLRMGVFAAVVALGTSTVSAQDMPPITAKLPPAAQRDVELAYLLANGQLCPDYLPTLLGPLANPGVETPLARVSKQREPIAVKAFDNLYYVGLPSVGTWALKTPAGIILWDTLDNADEAANILVPGLRKLGLNPADIKYIIVTHGHGDHYGGAKYLQDTYHPRILMGAADWDMIEKLPAQITRNGRTIELPPPPRRDLDVTDGQKLALGGTTVTLYVTPGHTPATVSSIIPSSFHGRRHVVAFWGGNGEPTSLVPTASTGGLLRYREQLFRFTKIALDRGVDSVISNHPIVDCTIAKAKVMATLKPDQDTPWAVGSSTFLRTMGSNVAAIDAGIAVAEQRH